MSTMESAEMEKFIIEGGHPLAGSVRPGGSKNEVLPVLAATLITDQTVTLDNVPRIEDVLIMLQIMERMGGRHQWLGPSTVEINNGGVSHGEAPADLCRKLRASILLAGPLLARFGSTSLAPPGGDVIGRRRLDTHFGGFTALGATVDFDALIRISSPGLTGADIFLDEPSVTGTENIVMAAVLATGRTIIRNAACEPHVQGLCRLLVTLGAQISGIGTNTLTIEGVRHLQPGRHRISSDYLEIGSFIGLAAMTGSAITIEDVVPDDVRMIGHIFSRLGVEYRLAEGNLHVPAEQELAIRNDFGNQIPKIDDGPWPAFPTDMMSIAITVATQSRGMVLFFEKMFDGRMFFTDSLVSMGARIILCDPHRVVVSGPAQLTGTTLSSPDVRAGMALVLAALAAKGKSTIYNVRHIDRGYERIEDKLRALGAKIERLPG
jgi:UDP-N-acetylglucosamine 1-carboxyvinyltransferase